MKHESRNTDAGHVRQWQFSVVDLLKLTALVAIGCAAAFVVLPPLVALAIETLWLPRLLGGLLVLSLVFVSIIIAAAAYRLLTLVVPTGTYETERLK